MSYLFLSFSIFFISSCLTLLFKEKKWKRYIGCGGVFVGSLLGLIPTVVVLSTGLFLKQSLGSPIPGLTITLEIDSLSAFFLMAIFGLSLVVAVYSLGYIKGNDRLLGSLPFFPLLVAAMSAVVTARDGFLFLICWEVMSLTSFFLVTSEHEIAEVRHAGWVYLIATHIATAFLIAFFLLLFKQCGSFLFEDFSRFGPMLSSTLAATLFLFAVIGFGTKAGLFPFHVWLPHAHPAAPSYISALMSGVMIKTGIYGILRALTFLGTPPLWWGEFLVGMGVLSAVIGVLYALMQHDLKRLLAYHSIENIGIIVAGIGLGMVGITLSQPNITILGFGGALLHVWNHGIFKGLLFLGAGNVAHVTHSREIDRLGGLLKRMPVSGATFLIASVAICGLPPLNGFISEWLIYLGFFKGVTLDSHTSLFFSIAGIVGIAFAGGLAIACFTKVVGVVFLGEPRSENAATSREVSKIQLAPMVLLAFLCFLIGLYPQMIWPAVFSTVTSFVPLMIGAQENTIFNSLALISGTLGLGLLVFIFMCILARYILGNGRIRRAVTWDCGYTLPTPRMQYTASSFAEPLGVFFSSLLKSTRHLKKPSLLFPLPGFFSEHTDDLAERSIFKPLFNAVDKSFSFLRRVLHGKIQGYLAMIFVTLIILLLWEVWFGI